MVNVISEPIITPVRVRPSSSGSAINTSRTVSGIPRWTGKASASGSGSTSQKTSSIVKKKVPLGERSDVDNSLSASQSSQTSQSRSTKMKPKVKPTGQRPPTGITTKAPRFSLAITSTPRPTSSRKPSSENDDKETPSNPPPRTVGGSTPHPRYSLPRLSMGDDTMLMDMSMSGLDADFLDTDASDVEESGTGRNGHPAKGRSGMVGGLLTPANSQDVETHSPRHASPGIAAKRTFDPVFSRLPTPPSSQANEAPTPPRDLGSRIRPRPSPTPPRRVSTDPSATLIADLGLTQDPSPNPRRKKTPRVEATGSPAPARTSPSLSQSQRVRQRFEVVITPRAPPAKSVKGRESTTTPARSPPLAPQSSVTFVNGIPVRTFAAPSTAPPAVRRPRSSLAASTRKRAVTPKTVQAKPRSKPSPPKTAPRSNSRARQSMTPSAIKALAGRKLGITPKPLKGSPGDDPLLLVGWEEDAAVRNSRLRTELEAERVETEARSSTVRRERSSTPRPLAKQARDVDDPPPLAVDARLPREPTPTAETTHRFPSPSPGEDHDLTLHGFSHLGEDFDGLADLDPGFGSDTDFEDEVGIGNDTFVHVRARMGMPELGDISGLQALTGPSDHGSSSITLAPEHPLNLRPHAPSSPMLPQLAGTSFSPLRSPSLVLRGSSLLPDHIEDSIIATPASHKDQEIRTNLPTAIGSDIAEITVRVDENIDLLHSTDLTVGQDSELQSDAGDLEGDTTMEAEAGRWDLSDDQSIASQTAGDATLVTHLSRLLEFEQQPPQPEAEDGLGSDIIMEAEAGDWDRSDDQSLAPETASDATLAPHPSPPQESEPHSDADEHIRDDITVEVLAEHLDTSSDRMVSPAIDGDAAPAPAPPVEAARESPEMGLESKELVAGIALQDEEPAAHDAAGARSAPASPVSLPADDVEPVESPVPVTTPLADPTSPVELHQELPKQNSVDMQLDLDRSLEAEQDAASPSPYVCPEPAEQMQLAATVAAHTTDQLDEDDDRLTAELEDEEPVRRPTPASPPASPPEDLVESIPTVPTVGEDKREEETLSTLSSSQSTSAIPLEKEVSTISPVIASFRHSPSLFANVVPQLDDDIEPEAVEDQSQEGDLTVDAQSADWDLSDEVPLDLPEGAQDNTQDLADVTGAGDATANAQDEDEVVPSIEEADHLVSTGSSGLLLSVESDEAGRDFDKAAKASDIVLQADFASSRLDIEPAVHPAGFEEVWVSANDEDDGSQRQLGVHHIDQNASGQHVDVEEQDHEVPEDEENEAADEEEIEKPQDEVHVDDEGEDEDECEDGDDNDLEDEDGGDDQKEEQDGQQVILEGKMEGEVQADQVEQADESASQLPGGNTENNQREEPTSPTAHHHTASERIVLKLVSKGIVKLEPEDLGVSSRDTAPASPAFSPDEAPVASPRAARLSIPPTQVRLQASSPVSDGLPLPATSTSPTTADNPRVGELEVPVRPNTADAFSVHSSSLLETNATIVLSSAVPTTSVGTGSTPETTTPALPPISLPSESASSTPKSDPPLAAFRYANTDPGGVPALERMLWRNTTATHVPSRLAMQVTGDTPSTPSRESPASDDEDDDTELRGNQEQGRDDEENAGDRSVRIRSARKSLHDELAGADGDTTINSVVEVASLDPRAAARAAAILKLNHAYIEHGVLPSSSTPRRTPRRRSIHESSFFGSIESARKLTKDELLHEAELEIVASRSQRARSASVLSTMTTATAATAATGYSEMQLPGGWVRTPKRKRSDPVTETAPSSSIPIPGASVKEIRPGDRPWGVPEWKRLEKVFRREREAWIKEREVKALPGGLIGWAKRMSTGPKKVVEWDEERVVARFYKDEGIEEEMRGEWARNVLLLRVKALERRVIDTVEKHTSEPSTERSPKKAKVDGIIVQSTPAKSFGESATEPPSTIKRAFGWMMGWSAQNSSAVPAKADAPLCEERIERIEEAANVSKQPEDDRAGPEEPTHEMKQVSAGRPVSDVAAQLESAGRALGSTEAKDDRRSTQHFTERQGARAPFTPAHPSSSSWTPPLRPGALPSVRPAVSALSLTSTLTASRSLPADLSASTSTIATYLNTPAPRLYPSLDPPLTQRSSAIKALFPEIHPLGSSTDSVASMSSATSRPEPLPMPTGIKKRDSVKDLIRSFQEKGVLDKAFQAKERRPI